MKLVDRKTFMSMPAGTLFRKVPEPWIIEPLSIKGDTMGADFGYMELAQPETFSGEDFIAPLHDLEVGGSRKLETDGYGRDGVFQDTDMFLVLDDDDRRALVEILIAATPQKQNPA